MLKYNLAVISFGGYAVAVSIIGQWSGRTFRLLRVFRPSTSHLPPSGSIFLQGLLISGGRSISNWYYCYPFNHTEGHSYENTLQSPKQARYVLNE